MRWWIGLMVLVGGCVSPASGPAEDKILWGSDGDIRDFPFLVYMQHREPSGSWTTSCTGALIDETTVLTAAHCVDGGIPLGAMGDLRLVAATSAFNVDDSAIVRQVVGAAVHPRYAELLQATECLVGAAESTSVDLALLRIDRAFGSWVTPIRLASTRPSSGTSVVAAGWGAVSRSGRRADQLQTAALEVATAEMAAAENVVEENIAVYDSGWFWDSEICQGDSGSPLLVPKAEGGYEVAGVLTTARRGDGQCFGMAVYSDTARHLTWFADASARLDLGEGWLDSPTCFDPASVPAQIRTTSELDTHVGSSFGLRPVGYESAIVSSGKLYLFLRFRGEAVEIGNAEITLERTGEDARQHALTRSHPEQTLSTDPYVLYEIPGSAFAGVAHSGDSPESPWIVRTSGDSSIGITRAQLIIPLR